MLQHHYKHTAENPNTQALKHRISSCEQKIMETMENNLIDALGEQDNDMIHSVLSAYSSMSKCTSAEEIIRHNLCRPVMQQTLEKANIQNLPSIFNDILDFVPTYLKTIQQIITGKYKKMHAIAGYDFIARSVFPEIVSGLQTYLPSLELQCSSQQSVMRLRESQSYRTFQNSFLLDNYFKLASHKLITQLETCLTYDLKLNKNKQEPRLESTETVIKILENCNSDKVLLPGLLHRFYKLQIQIVYRYAKWASSVMSYASSSPEIFEQINYLNLVNLYDDITYLSKILEKQIFAQLMEKISSFGSEKLEQIKNSNQFIHKRLLEPTVIIANHVQNHLVEKSLDGIKAVNDIPRQYRRTNRAEPKEPSTYVASLIKPSTEYYNSTKDTSNWIAIIFEQIANQYAKRITEVLEASRKMEASLEKLKQMRKTKATEKNDKMSDDDKIRLQIKIDVEHFGTKFIELGVGSDDPNYISLSTLANGN